MLHRYFDKVGALEGEVAALEEELAKAKHDNMVAAEALNNTSEKLAEFQREMTDMLALEGDCEGCYYKATKNYRKCNSCTRNEKAVDKYITEADFFAAEAVPGEEPTPEEAASATDVAELHEGTIEVDVAELHEETVEVDVAEPAQASEPTSDAESTPKPTAPKPVKKTKKKNRKKK